jgi:DnaJ family protein C protein 13
VQTAALRKLGLTLAVDSNAALDGPRLLAAVAAAERERAATAADAPLGEWDVIRVRELLEGGDPAASRAAADVSGWSGVTHRRLVLTRGGLLERRPGDYEVAEWRQLPAIAALVRFADDPQWLGVEWADGTPSATYVTPARCVQLACQPPACSPACCLPAICLLLPAVCVEQCGWLADCCACNQPVWRHLETVDQRSLK